MNGYGQYCPIARATELFAERWTPLILRELLFEAHRFSELARGLPGISRSLLAQRLARLNDVGIVERRAGPRGAGATYWLTPKGRALGEVVQALGDWGANWAFDDGPHAGEVDPKLLLWWMRRRIHLDRLPPQRVTVRFEFRGVRTPFWLLLERPEPSVCLTDPGFGLDLVVDADLAAFYQAWLGRVELTRAIATGQVQIDGPPALVRAFPSWLQLSKYAPAIRARHLASGTLAV